MKTDQTSSAVEALKEIAKAKACRVHLEPVSYSHLFHKSFISWDNYTGQPKGILCYYHTPIHQLLTLAHEVGHLETTKPAWVKVYGLSPAKTYRIEAIASTWALQYLTGRVSDTIHQYIYEIYFQCLYNYKPTRARQIILDYKGGNLHELQNSFKD